MTNNRSEFVPQFSSSNREFAAVFQSGSLGGGAVIDDEHILTTSTWSSSKINSELSNNGVKANTTTLAAAYTSGTHYYIGDLCSHNGNVYKCTAEISSAPATWDSSKWALFVVLEAFATVSQVQGIISGYSPT